MIDRERGGWDGKGRGRERKRGRKRERERERERVWEERLMMCLAECFSLFLSVCVCNAVPD